MAESIIDSFDKENKDFVVNSLINNVSQRKIAEELSNRGIAISDVSIGRWWKENKSKYFDEDNNSEDAIDTKKIIDELISRFDKKGFKKKEYEMRLLTQQLLQELMLTYIVDINHQTKLRQQNLINHYPTELISSLKVISDLCLRVREDNKYLKDE
jgi:transposase-like protein